MWTFDDYGHIDGSRELDLVDFYQFHSLDRFPIIGNNFQSVFAIGTSELRAD